MANQPAPPTRQWLRLPTLARSSITPLPPTPPAVTAPPSMTVLNSPSKPPPTRSPALRDSLPTSPKPKGTPPPSPAKAKSDTEAEAMIPLEEQKKAVVMVEKRAIEEPKPRLLNDSNSHRIAHLGNQLLSKDVITLTGDNKGAVMQISHSPMKKNVLKEKPEEEEGNMKKKEKSHKGKKIGWGKTSAFINSNVQGVNNSLIYSSTCTGHDPGVHLSLY